MSRRAVQDAPRSDERATGSMMRVTVGIVALAAFAAFFFLTPIQNNATVRRITILLLLPEYLLDNVLPAADAAMPSGWRYLPQRFDLIAVATVIFAGTWGIGGLLLRVLTQGERRPSGLRSDRVERTVLAFGVGLSAWSLLTLGFGLLGLLSRPVFVAVLLAACVTEGVLAFRERTTAMESGRGLPKVSRSLLIGCSIGMAPFLLAAAFGSMLPPIDFDVKEYHLGGPKEWFLDGRVHFLPHNVYTSFPFLTEMLSLSAMVIRGDWSRGGLAGQFVLAGFLPLTSATIFVIGRRLFGATAGLLGALVYVTAPWAYRISVIAYAEGGLSCFVALSVLGMLLTIERLRTGQGVERSVLLTGVFAGSAMACKYPGVVQVVIPVGAALFLASWRAGGVGPPSGFRSEIRSTKSETSSKSEEPKRIDRERFGHSCLRFVSCFVLRASDFPRLGELTPPARRVVSMAAIYAAGILIAVGPWLVKNVIETGNPVYPLLWEVFGGHDWNAELNAKWEAAHSPPHYLPAAFGKDLLDVVARSDWQSLLVFGFAPFAFLRRERSAVAALWGYVAFLLAAWWLLTHRIDRFWVPLLPVACVLAGAGLTWPAGRGEPIVSPASRLWRSVAGVTVAVAVLFNLAVVTSGLSGPPDFLADQESFAKAVETPGLSLLNRRLPSDAKVLSVGEAAIFDARFPILYNTVFDKSLFEAWTAAPGAEVPPTKWPLRPVEEIRRTFAEQGVTHVYVNWSEILRYRTTYGYTSYVTPDRFAELVRAGVLGEPERLRTVPWEGVAADRRNEVERHLPALVVNEAGERYLTADVLYPVVR